MDSSRQRGKADLTTLIFFVVLGFVFWAGWRVIPVYYDHYSFRDQVEEICRTPPYKARNPEVIYEKLLKATRDARLDTWILRQNFTVTSTESRRTIVLYYEREVEILPGWKHTFKFETLSDQPLI
jgi:hypothetical protein